VQPTALLAGFPFQECPPQGVIVGAASYGLVVGRLEPIRWDAPEASASL